MTKKLDEKNFLSTNFTRVQTRIPNVLPGGNQSDSGGFSVAPELEVQAVRANRQTLYRRSKRIVSMIPYGVRAKLVHKLTPKATEMISRDRGERRMQFKETRVSVKKDFKYGEDERQKFDVYLPPARSIRRGKKDDYDDDDEYEEREEEAENVRVPMAVFVHGGVWASGERWQFAPLAHRLAEEGIVTAVISYSLYPEKSAKAQAEEVLKALKCAIMNAEVVWRGCEQNAFGWTLGGESFMRHGFVVR